MTFVPHLRMSCLGTLPGGEIFSFGLSLATPGVLDGGGLIALLNLGPNDAVYDDLRDDCVEYFQSNLISGSARLMSVKFAPIGSDGKYSGPAVERQVAAGVGAPGAVGGVNVPNQIALAVTTHSASDLGRVKGRWYLPAPSVGIQADGTITEANRDAYEASATTFINNVNNQPGLDVLDLRAVVASQGRKNPDGSVKLAPGNHEITAVSVGRVLDTQRRRRNKLREFRGTPTAVS